MGRGLGVEVGCSRALFWGQGEGGVGSQLGSGSGWLDVVHGGAAVDGENTPTAHDLLWLPRSSVAVLHPSYGELGGGWWLALYPRDAVLTVGGGARAV